MSKKLNLLKAASRVILSHGVAQLTLEAVALEANVSKGGLQYHYRTKEELIIAMNIHVIEQFRELIQKEVTAGHSYHEAYLLATLNSLKDADYLNVNTSLLAAISNNPAILALWKEEYKTFHEQLTKEQYPPSYSLLVQTVCDGLWFSKMFDLSHFDTKEEQQLIEYVLKLSEDE